MDLRTTQLGGTGVSPVRSKTVHFARSQTPVWERTLRKLCFLSHEAASTLARSASEGNRAALCANIAETTSSSFIIVEGEEVTDAKRHAKKCSPQS